MSRVLGRQYTTPVFSSADGWRGTPAEPSWACFTAWQSMTACGGAGEATTAVAAVVVLVVVAVAVDGGGSGYRRLWLNVPQISRSSWLLLLIYGIGTGTGS